MDLTLSTKARNRDVIIPVETLLAETKRNRRQLSFLDLIGLDCNYLVVNCAIIQDKKRRMPKGDSDISVVRGCPSYRKPRVQWRWGGSCFHFVSKDGTNAQRNHGRRVSQRSLWGQKSHPSRKQHEFLRLDQYLPFKL